MTIVRALIGLAGIALTALILWALFAQKALHGGFWDQVGVITTMPWGQVTLADLYLGFVISAMIVLMTERTRLSAIAWALPIFVLGNIWTALWLVIRFPTLVRRLTRPDEE